MSENNGKSTALVRMEARRKISTIDVEEHEVTALVAQAKALWPSDLTPEGQRAVATVALQYGLDPLAGELIVYQGKPYITVDGRLRKARESGKWQGIIEDRPATPDEYKALHVPVTDMLWFITIKHADWIKPNGAYGRVKTNEDRNVVARQHPAEVARKRSLYRALREAFGMPLPGVYDDEPIATDGLDNSDGPIVNTMAGQGQIAVIHELKKQLGFTEDEYRQWLMRGFGVKSSKELTEFQADDLIRDWEERAVQKQKPAMAAKDEADLNDCYGTTYQVQEHKPSPAPRQQNGKPEPAKAGPGAENSPYQKPTDPPTPALWKRWQDLWNEAQQLGIEFEGVTPDISKADLIAKGQALKAKIDAWHDKPRTRVDHEPIDQRPDTVEDGADVPGMDELETDAERAGVGL